MSDDHSAPSSGGSSILLEIACVVQGDGLPKQQRCEDFVPPNLHVEPCNYTPFTTTLTYNGGDCSQSDNDLLAPHFTCRDGETSSPPEVDGKESYIVVTNSKVKEGKKATYFEGWVAVGSDYVLDNGAAAGPMEDGFWIHIYDSEDRLNLLQEVKYGNSLCSSEDELLARFGASQIVSYTNEQQGVVSPFGAFSYEAALSVTIETPSALQEATLESLQLLTSFAGLLDLSHQVKGQRLEANSSLKLRVPVQIDLTKSQKHSLTSYLSASQWPSESTRTDVTFHIFQSGSRPTGWVLSES